MPPKNKSKNAPNQHDKRHESGLAAPGKRVTKQRSNGQLNGQANGKPSHSVSPVPAIPSTGLNHGFHFPRPGEDSSLPSDPSVPTRDHAGTPEGAARGRIPSDVSLEDVGPSGEMGDPSHHSHEPGPLAVGVEPIHSYAPTYRRSLPGSRGSTLSVVSTILSNYPLRDAISILILLLSLPPTLVLVIQSLFASLTFVPPTAGLSFSALPNVKEMFNSSGLGYPALATILIVDLIFWICWLPVWTPLQGMFLDLSQAVIAVSLSGAAAGNERPTYSIATSSAIVCVVHMLRYKAIHLTALDYLRSVIHRIGVGIPTDASSFAAHHFSSSSPERGWIYSAIRTMLGIHIVSQGVTTWIRRSLVKANEQSAIVPPLGRSDFETNSGSEPNSRPNGVAVEAGQHSAQVTPSDGRLPASAAAQRDNKSRESTSKKKRKQANQVRSQQPLWAAIASTKVTFIKEVEQRDAADDAREACVMDPNANASTIITNVTSDRVWIREVRDTEILFTVQLSAQTIAEGTGTEAEATNIGPGIDKSKPFYVRINGATWSSTRIAPSFDDDDETVTSQPGRYEGEIFGLAPLSSYHCEIVGVVGKEVICDASVITQPAPAAEQTTSSVPQPPHQALRPSSPITTLKQSIQAAEARLSETRNRGKKSKKDQRAVHSDIKREINTLRVKLDSSGGTDDKQERRLMQINQHKNQAEEATADLKVQIEALGAIPEEEIAESEAQRGIWQAALNARKSARTALENAKSEADQELSNLKSDIYQAESKREKLLARHAQRTQDMEKLVSKQHADMTAKQKRDIERAQIMQAREKEEQQLRFHITNFEAESQTFQHKAHDAYQQIASMQSWPSQQPPPYPGYSSPPTPEHAHAIVNGAITSPPPANGFLGFAPQPPFSVSPFNSGPPVAPPPLPGAPRARSSSMLSQYSGFTDSDGDMPAFSEPPRQPNLVAPAILDERKESEGSGSLTSGSTGSNSPRPDAKPFVPGKSAPSPAGQLHSAVRNDKEKPPQSPLQTSASVNTRH